MTESTGIHEQFRHFVEIFASVAACCKHSQLFKEFLRDASHLLDATGGKTDREPSLHARCQYILVQQHQSDRGHSHMELRCLGGSVVVCVVSVLIVLGQIRRRALRADAAVGYAVVHTNVVAHHRAAHRSRQWHRQKFVFVVGLVHRVRGPTLSVA